VRHSRQGYHGSISFIDEQIGRILEALDARGELDETLILYFSDHGDMTGDHHMWRKCFAYEASVRVPMLIRWPTGLVAAERGQVIDKPVEIRDILPTMLDAAGQGERDDMDGRSMLPLLQSNDAQWREFIDLEHSTCYSPKNHWTALTDGHTKYIFHALDGEEQLFDLTGDPHEQHDLASDTTHEDKLRLWRNRMIEHLAERGEPFVKNGKLMARPKRFLHSPHYPQPA